MYVSMYAYMCVWVCVCMCVCACGVYVCMCVCGVYACVCVPVEADLVGLFTHLCVAVCFSAHITTSPGAPLAVCTLVLGASVGPCHPPSPSMTRESGSAPPRHAPRCTERR